jgi:hypothetical protein
MKPTLYALTALGALVAASPALAQNNGYYGQNNGSYYSSTNNDRYYDHAYNGGWEGQLSSRAAIDARISRLGARLDAGVRAGTIDRYEAGRLTAELNDLRNLSRSYAYGGINASERADIAARLRSVREDIRTADNGSWDRYDSAEWGAATGYGYNEGYDTRYNNGTAGYGSTYNNRTYGSTYDNRGYGNGGTYNNGAYGNGYGSSANNGYYGQGGPYEEVETCDSRGGIVGGLVDSVVGRNCTTVMLRVGDRAAANLYAVPYELQGQYRDGYGYYYRSDGRAIYQIDTRTNTVLRIYPMNR